MWSINCTINDVMFCLLIEGICRSSSRLDPRTTREVSRDLRPDRYGNLYHYYDCYYLQMYTGIYLYIYLSLSLSLLFVIYIYIYTHASFPLGDGRRVRKKAAAALRQVYLAPTEPLSRSITTMYVPNIQSYMYICICICIYIYIYIYMI